MSRALGSLFLVGSLAACGGGTGTGTGTGPSGGGSAAVTAPTLSGDVASFARSRSFASTSRAARVSGGTADAFPETVQISAAPDGSGDLVVNFGSGDVRLQQQSSDDSIYLFDNGVISLAGRTALGQDAGILFLISQSANAQAGGFHAFGNETADVAALSGSAYYVGPSAYIATTTGGQVNGGSGGVVLEVDFDGNDVDGVLALQDTGGTNFTVGFENAPISGSGFSSQSLVTNGLSGTVASSELNGRFYGSGAGEAAGTFYMNIADGASASHVSGAFLGSQQSQAAVQALASGQGVSTQSGEQIVLGSGSVVGGSGSVYPNGASSYYNSNTNVSFGADGGGCYYVGDWSNC